MEIRLHQSILEIPAAAWDRLLTGNCPFMRHAFLAALERNHCTGERFGWLPRHLVAYEQDRVVGAIALFEKDNSYGEFVFDWAWADAYQRNGLPYYPKLVVAAPYTPATGPRLLLAADCERDKVANALIDHSLQLAERLAVSSLHYLFTTEAETRDLEARGFMARLGCQFHWHNHGYRDFEDFLGHFTSKKRKQVRQERRYAASAGAEIEIIRGDQATPEQLEVAAHFYHVTFDRKWGTATLNAGFFREVAQNMGDQLLLILARRGPRYIAGAICFRDQKTLYGRHWGCTEHHPHLHFEICFYQGIDYCIREGLSHFEPGAQGEHKISRGFLPTPTWSAHWIKHPRFRDAIAHFLHEEQDAMRDYMQELQHHSPYKTPAK